MPDKTASHPTWSAPRESKTFSSTKLVRSHFDGCIMRWMQLAHHAQCYTAYGSTGDLFRVSSRVRWFSKRRFTRRSTTWRGCWPEKFEFSRYDSLTLQIWVQRPDIDRPFRHRAYFISGRREHLV